MTEMPGPILNVDHAVGSRYSQAARTPQPSLCCPVNYDPRWLEVIPQEIAERDYGCGDPSRDLRPGETVLDLGSGGGKMCYIAAQVVGARGRVIGVDCNDDMLALARKHQRAVAERLGYANVEFRKGRIQDLQLNLELFDQYLAEHPPRSSTEWLRAEEHARQLRQTAPLVTSRSVDVVVSNCVLNLVRKEDRRALFAEILRVLKPGGRAVVSDIVSDADVPEALQADPQLWSGCISGAFREDHLPGAFEEAGFHGIEIIARQSEPWAVVQGIPFRSLTVRAYKAAEAAPSDQPLAVIYHGPWKAVQDDAGRILRRGERTAIDAQTATLYAGPPYAGAVTLVPPPGSIPAENACCGGRTCC